MVEFCLVTLCRDTHRIHGVGEDHPCKGNQIMGCIPGFDLDHQLGREHQDGKTTHGD